MQIQITKKYKCHIMMWELLLKILKSLKITCEEVHFKQIALKDMSLSKLSPSEIAFQVGTSQLI